MSTQKVYALLTVWSRGKNLLWHPKKLYQTDLDLERACYEACYAALTSNQSMEGSMFRIQKTLAQLSRTLSDLLLKYADDAHLPSSSSAAPFLLHRYQWRCLLAAYRQLFRRIDDVLIEILEAPLQALLFALKSAERSLTECVAPQKDGADLDLWMMQKALKHGLSGEVADLHMDNLQTCAIGVFESLTNYYASAEDLDLANVIKKGKDVGGGSATMTTQVEQQKYRSRAPNVEDLDLDRDLALDLDLDRALDRDLASAQSFFRQQFGSPRTSTCEIAKLILNRISLCSHTDPNTTTVMERLKVAPARFSDVIENNRIKVIGEGGFGKVIEKKWILESHVVAVKEVHVFASSSHQKQSVYDEAATQARLYHPNLLPLLSVTEEEHDDAEEEGAVFFSGNKGHIVGLVMERMPCNLDFLMEKRKVPFPLHVSVNIMMQIAIGMEYLHSSRIIHRDLKPANILISPDSVGLDDNRSFVGVKIADFGVSKALASNYSSSLPHPHTANVGTSVWRAPEVMRLDLSNYDREEDPKLSYSKKADVYSFAMVCYQLMTGRVPFEGDVSQSILSRYRKIQNEHYRPTFNEQDSACPVALIDMIQCCWRTDPSQRPAFTEIASFLRYVKACAVPLVGSRGEKYEVDNWKIALVQIFHREKLFSAFLSNDRRGSNRMNSIEMCMEMRRKIMAVRGYPWAVGGGGERSSNDSATTTTSNGKIFGVSIGSNWNGVTLNNIPINNSGAEVHVFLSFAIDYTSDGSSANGNFQAFWDTNHITPDAIRAFKSSHSNVKIIISLGGATIVEKSVQFKPATVSSWVTNAVSSLTTLIQTYHADGIDVDYESFDYNTATASDFASAAGQLITKLKQANVITIASIAPSTVTQAPYVALWNAYSSVIDYVNYQFFELGSGTTVAQYVTRYNTVKSTYSGAKVLSSLITEEGSKQVRPSVAIQASQQLHNSGGLPGIFIFSADDSYDSSEGFTYEEQAQAIFAS